MLHETDADPSWLIEPGIAPGTADLERLAAAITRVLSTTSGSDVREIPDRIRDRANQLAKRISRQADDVTALVRRSQDAHILPAGHFPEIACSALAVPLENVATTTHLPVAAIKSLNRLLAISVGAFDVESVDVQWWSMIENLSVEAASLIRDLLGTSDVSAGRLESLARQVCRLAADTERPLPASPRFILWPPENNRLMHPAMWRRGAITGFLSAYSAQRSRMWTPRRQEMIVLAGLLQDLGLLHIDRRLDHHAPSQRQSAQHRWGPRHPELGAAIVALLPDIPAELPSLIAAHHRVHSCFRPPLSPGWSNRMARMVISASRFTELMQAYQSVLPEITPERHWSYSVAWRLFREARLSQRDHELTENFLAALDPGFLTHVAQTESAPDSHVLRVDMLPEVSPGWLGEGLSWRIDLYGTVGVVPPPHLLLARSDRPATTRPADKHTPAAVPVPKADPASDGERH